MKIVFESGMTWLKRDDGWQYPLRGIHSLDLRSTYDEVVYLARISDISDETLKSIRVLRDELANPLPGCRINLQIESAY